MQSSSFPQRQRRPIIKVIKGMLAVAFLGGCRVPAPDYEPAVDAGDAGSQSHADAGDAGAGDAADAADAADSADSADAGEGD
jgi:hypothetical protein